MRARTCVICACLLSACLFPDLGDLNGDGGGADTGSGDTSKPDVLIGDGGTDAPNDAPFCKRANHSLCDDFDEVALGAAWTSQHVSFTTLALDDASATSSPNSLLAIDPTGTNNGAYAYLQKDFTGSASRVVCEMQLRVEKIGAAPAYAFQLVLTPTNSPMSDYHVGVLQYATKTQIVEGYDYVDGGSGGQNSDLSKPISADAGTFTRVTIDAKLGSSASIAVMLDGATVLATTLAAPASTAQTITLGFQEYFGTAARIRYDDVACDFTP